MDSNKIIHFEVTAEDPDRAEEFYKKTFDWDIDESTDPSDYRLISTGQEEEGLNGGLCKRNDPEESILITVSVDSVDNYLKKVEENGGEIVNPKRAIPGVGYHATCRDTEGNLFDIMEEDEEAQ